jgi:hypothetical protein
MVKFAFQAASVGVKVGSVGEFYLAFDYGDAQHLYRIMCTGSDIGLTNCQSREPVEIPDVNLPRDMNERHVRFKLEGGVFFWGLTEVEFGLYESNANDPVYTFKRRVPIAGGCVGGVDILSTMKHLDANRHRLVDVETRMLLHK